MAALSRRADVSDRASAHLERRQNVCCKQASSCPSRVFVMSDFVRGVLIGGSREDNSHPIAHKSERNWYRDIGISSLHFGTYNCCRRVDSEVEISRVG